MERIEHKSSNIRGSHFGRRERKYQRAPIPGFVASIADGKKLIDGQICDLSTGGFQIASLPPSFNGERHTYTAVVSGRGRHYKLLAKPCWTQKDEKNSGNFGFKILDAPWEWVEFTMNEIA